MFSMIKLTCSNDRVTVLGEASHQSGASVQDAQGRESGVCGSWNWDGSVFNLQTDRFGYLPFYYHHDPSDGTLRVSDNPLSIVSDMASPRLDPRALGFFCRSGFMLGDTTIYEGVKRAPAHSCIEWSAGSLTISPNQLSDPPDPPKSVEEALDGWIERFRMAMKHRCRPDQSYGMPLSAGRDSRMMLLELHALGSNPSEVLTIGSRDNDDVRIARLIADRMSIPFHWARPAPGNWIDMQNERHVKCGFEALEHAWILPFWKTIARRHGAWYDGLGSGSVIRNSVNDSFALDLLRANRTEEWARLFFSRTSAPSEEMVERVARCSPLPLAPLDDVLDLLEVELARHRDQPNPITSFTFHNWGRRSISLNPFGLCRETRSIGVPFMDRELVEWTLSIPADWCFTHDIQTMACQRLYPEFSDVPFTLGARSNRNHRSGLARVLDRHRKKRFFHHQAPCFRTLFDELTRGPSGSPDSFRAINLMMHLALVDKTLGTPTGIRHGWDS